MRIFCQRKVANATRTFAFKIKNMHESSIVTITILICLFAFLRFSEVKADYPGGWFYCRTSCEFDK